MTGSTPDRAKDDAARPEKRTPHSIRFLDAEWERIEKFAEKRGLTGPELVRFAALETIAEGRPPVLAARTPVGGVEFRPGHGLGGGGTDAPRVGRGF